MKKTLALALGVLALFIYGCGSSPTMEDKAAVEDRTPGSGAAVKPPAAQPGTGSQDAVTSKPIVIKPQTGDVPNILKDPNSILSKRSIFFDYDSDAIKDEFRPLVQAHAKYLSNNRNARVLVQGNADDRGSREYNLALGQRRSEAVKRMLVLLGAQDSQVESVSLGEEKPRCEQSNDACYAQNRRGDLLYGGEY